MTTANTTIEKLTTLIPPIGPSSNPIDWPTVETALGMRLPSDYRSLYEAYGEGSFNGYLWFLSPERDENVGIIERSEEMRWMLAYLKEDDPEMIPYDVSPGSRQLLGAARPSTATRSSG